MHTYAALTSLVSAPISTQRKNHSNSLHPKTPSPTYPSSNSTTLHRMNRVPKSLYQPSTPAILYPTHPTNHTPPTPTRPKVPPASETKKRGSCRQTGRATPSVPRSSFLNPPHRRIIAPSRIVA
ncbi:hypothetical protein BU16DRAFT_524167 [Lophium mytilinum]|uniref:Uncharacterized protein n=1 Tax=Lophium mytilinum TaxID=390894 RepID=A0A6A6R7J6_9PEZI|nr:hypothetical protein BU16DRAFT_524167 [Lophium mytilinum]